MSDPILTLLNSSNPTQRKRGIGAAAKSADKRYLQALAAIYKTDPEPELRQLARKAGVYINKNGENGAASPAPAPAKDDSFTALRGELLSDMGVSEPELAAPPRPAAPRRSAPAPKPADTPPQFGDLLDGSVPVMVPDDTEINPEAAHVHYNTAFDLHLKGNNGRAALELATAFRLNPAYAQDKTAVAFAAELTGKPPHQAAAYIADPANWRAITDDLGGIQGDPDANANLRGMFAWIFGAVGVFVVALLILLFMGSPLFEQTLQQFTDNTFGSFFGDESPVTGGGMIFFALAFG